ncbi:MAG: Bug family tripartite tricarboxylate transporter substrate binding protein [Burkholderiaceae bacterium]
MDRRRLLLATAGTLAAPAFVRADDWPRKTIRLVVPFAPGGSSEIVARSVAAELTKQLGQSVYVENKPGGAGTVAMADVAKADKDGHTLILGHVGTLAVNPVMLPKQPFDVDRDFTPVTLLARVPNLFVVHPDVPAKNLKEFIAVAKSRPGQLNYGSAGNGSAGHLSMEYLKLVSGTFITHIPYRGTGPQMVDLLAGRTECGATGAPASLPHVRSGKLRAIAVGSAQRVPVLPDVATVAEQGYPGFETSQWYGLQVPAGTPEAIVKRLADECAKALRSSAVTERFANDAAVGVGNTPEQYAAFIRTEQKRWGEVVRRAGIKPD